MEWRGVLPKRVYGEKSGVKESSEKLNIWKCGEAGGERNAVRRTTGRQPILLIDEYVR